MDDLGEEQTWLALLATQKTPRGFPLLTTSRAREDVRSLHSTWSASRT